MSDETPRTEENAVVEESTRIQEGDLDIEITVKVRAPKTNRPTDTSNPKTGELSASPKERRERT